MNAERRVARRARGASFWRDAKRSVHDLDERTFLLEDQPFGLRRREVGERLRIGLQSIPVGIMDARPSNVMSSMRSRPSSPCGIVGGTKNVIAIRVTRRIIVLRVNGLSADESKYCTRPESREAPEYYFKGIDLVQAEDIRTALWTQFAQMLSLLGNIAEEHSRVRYAKDKWSIRQVLGHLNDCERLFAFRAFWFARGFDTPLPDFDQEIAAGHDGAHDRSWSGLVGEFREIRASTRSFFKHLPDDAWLRRGVASGCEFTVRSLAYIIAGHAAHHEAILRQRYLPLIRKQS